MTIVPSAAHFLHDHMPYTSALSDTVLQTKDGDVVISFEVEGLTASMSEDREVDAAIQNFDMMLQSLNPRCGVYIHKVIYDAPKLTTATSTATSADNAFADAINTRWYDHLNTSGLKTKRTIVSFALRPNLGALSAQSFMRHLSANEASQNAENLRLTAELNSITQHFATILHPRKCTALTLSDGKLLGFLGKLVGRRASIILPAQTDGPITAPIVADRYHFSGDYFIIKEQDDKHRYGRVMAIKNYCSQTWATILDRLEMPMEMVITNSYTPSAPTKTLKLLRRTKVAMTSADDLRKTDQAELVNAQDDVASRRVGFGKHHLTITIFNDSKEQLDELTSITRANCEEVGLTMVDESTYAKEGFFAQFPGNYKYRNRAEYVSSKNFGNFAALHAMPSGRDASTSPWGEVVTHFKDVVGAPYAFNFHEKWSPPRDFSLGHTIIIGKSDAGKSTLAAFMMGQTIRNGGRCFVFDKDKGLEMAVRAFGGNYTPLRAGVPTNLNPFATEIDNEGIAWLGEWLEALVCGEAELDDHQNKRLYEILKDNADGGKALRNFTRFTPEFRSLDDDGHLVGRLQQWCDGGQFSWAFGSDHTGHEFALNDRVMGFDFTELLDKPRFRSPILSYILRLIERSIKDREPTLIIIDEAWNMMDDPYFVKHLKDWSVTMRKLNVVLLMMSQIVSHFANSTIADSLKENLATKIVFPNPDAEPEGYAFLGFNSKQRELATTPTGGQRLVLVQSGSDKTMLNVDLSALGPLLPALGGGKSGETFYGSDWRTRDDFWKGKP